MKIENEIGEIYVVVPYVHSKLSTMTMDELRKHQPGVRFVGVNYNKLTIRFPYGYHPSYVDQGLVTVNEWDWIVIDQIGGYQGTLTDDQLNKYYKVVNE